MGSQLLKSIILSAPPQIMHTQDIQTWDNKAEAPDLTDLTHSSLGPNKVNLDQQKIWITEHIRGM